MRFRVILYQILSDVNHPEIEKIPLFFGIQDILHYFSSQIHSGMKNTLFVLACTAILLIAFQPLNAQLDDGDTAPDWTLTDIFGNTHHLYDLLDQGKTVVIDFSATWCGPCWNYHQTGALETFYEEHGPDGTNESMVFWIEGDLSTDMDDLLGLTDQSQGDWVTGTSFPIIDLQVADFGIMDAYDIAYFPTIYKVCQDRKIYEVGQVGAPILTTWIESCSLEAELLSTNGTTCYGFGEGNADIEATGGYSSITYHWSNGDITEDLLDVEAGTYAVTVTEGNGRQILIDDVEISGPLTPIEVADFEVNDLLCFDDGTGSISIEVVGGNGGFSYFWSNGDNDPIILGLSAGQYTVTIEDAQGCEYIESYTVEEPEILDFEVELIADHCGQNQGTIVVTPSGGTEPYTLEASDGFVLQGSFTVVGLGQGDYVLDLYDANECAVGMEVSIENIEGPEIIMPAEPTVTCATGPVVIIPFILNPAGGDLEYSWSTQEGDIIDGEFDLACTVFAPGSYTLNIEDIEYGCDVQESIEVFGSIEAPDIDAGPDLVIDCGSQIVQPDVTTESGGDFLYAWTTTDGHILSGMNAPIPQFDAAGTYQVLVTNINTSCTNTDVVVVTDVRVFPDAAFAFSAEELVAKFNAVQIDATSYHWDFGDGQTSDVSNPEHTYNITGTYHVCLTVTNACGSDEHCLDIWVQSTTSAILVELGISNVSCFGAQDGTLEAIAVGGSGNYQFTWLAPDGTVLNGPVQTGLGPGLYLLTVSDDQGNVTQVLGSIFEPTILDVKVKTIPPGITGPGIDLTVNGGTQGYTFLWSNGATTEDLFSLPTGTYQCTVTDANGCEFVTQPIHIVNPEGYEWVRPGILVQILGNPADQPLIIIIDSDVDIAHTLHVFDALGQSLTRSEWMGREHELDLRAYPSGMYFIAIYAQQHLLKTIPIALWH